MQRRPDAQIEVVEAGAQQVASRLDDREALAILALVVHRRSVVACAFLTLLVGLFVAGPAASRQAARISPVPNSRDSNIRHLDELLAASPAVITEHIELSKVLPLGQPSGPATIAVLLVSWFAGVLAGWLILQRVSLTRRGRAPPRVAA